jgi:hypothetical protein
MLPADSGHRRQARIRRNGPTRAAGWRATFGSHPARNTGTAAGFGVRVMPTGRRFYFIRYRNKHGRSRWFTIGEHGKVTAEAARTMAQRILQTVAVDGTDPSGEREAFRAAPTVNDLLDRYVTEPYRATRQTMNGLLRFAHKLTWPEIVAGVYFINTAKPKMPRLQDSLASLPLDVRKEIEALVKECSVSLTAMMALKSIFIGPLVAAACVVVACTLGLNAIVRNMAARESFEPLNQTIQATSAEYAESEVVGTPA